MSSHCGHSSPSRFLKSSVSETIECDQHVKKITTNLRSFYENNELADIVLIAEIDKFKVHAHRNVLAASSDYFRGLFRSDMKESKSQEIILEEINGQTLKLIVDFMYSSSIELHSGTIESVLKTADFLQISTLTAACCKYMEKRLDATNCLSIWDFAEQFCYEELSRKANAFAALHFGEICKEYEFLLLNDKKLCQILSRDDLSITEEDLMRALARWFIHDEPNREKVMLNILGKVRFQYLETEFIFDIRHLVCKNIKCYELICSWLEWHMFPEKRKELQMENTERRNAKIALVGGATTGQLSMQTYNPHEDSWSIEYPHPAPAGKDNFRSFFVKKNLLIIGGMESLENYNTTNSVESLNMETNIWTHLPPMNEGRCLPAVAELNGDLYVLGGFYERYNHEYYERVWLASMEKFNFKTQTWTLIEMNTSFEYIKVAVLDGLLYIIGNDSTLMECYNPVSGKWTQTGLTRDKTGCGFVAVGGLLYTVGGVTNDQWPNNILECYDPVEDTWIEKCPLSAPTYNLRCASINNKIIACRGIIDSEYKNLVEEYDPKTNNWKTLAKLHEIPEQHSTSIFNVY